MSSSSAAGGASASKSALSLKWTYGFSKDTIGGVHSLATSTRNALFYPAGHTGVIYNYQHRTQRLLQGHSNSIACCAVTRDKRFIATADVGKESLVVVWDAITGVPVKTIFDPHPNGVVALDFSFDASYLVTLSAPEAGADGQRKQTMSVWEWTAPSSEPLCSAEVPREEGEGGGEAGAEGTSEQHCIKVNPRNEFDIITNGKHKVFFWTWEAGELSCYQPKLNAKDFQQTVAQYTTSTFLGAESAITATEDGDVIQWDVGFAETHSLLSKKSNAGGAETASSSSLAPRHALKIIRLGEGHAINFLCAVDDYICAGTSDGAVRFYDLRFRIIAWFEDLNAGAVTSVGFAANRPSNALSNASSGSSGSGNAEERDANPDVFSVPDFIVGTDMALVVGVEAAAFEEVEEENRRGVLLVQGIDADIRGLATHPSRREFVVSSASGTLQMWSMEHKTLMMVASYKDEKTEPSCLVFDPQGRYLAQSFANGLLTFLDLETLTPIKRFRNTVKGITHLKFSPDGVFVAVADDDFCVGVYRFKEADPVAGKPPEWVYLGKNRAHSARITGLEFASSVHGPLLLTSVSEDQHLAEFDLDTSSVARGLVFRRSRIRVGDTSTPTDCIYYPLTSEDVREDIIVTSTTEFKFEHWNTETAQCVRTSLAPAYAGPIHQMCLLPGVQNGEAFLAYATYEKVVGLVKFPLDGNPTKAMGIIAHPGQVSAIAASYEGKSLVTAGREDMTIGVWDVNLEAIDTAVRAEPGIEPYLKLLGDGEGDEPGSAFSELKDYFYYSQLRARGENSTEKRKVTGRVSLGEIPNLVRALGFYPTQKQIERMVEEVKYHNNGGEKMRGQRRDIRSAEEDSESPAPLPQGRVVQDIDLADFVKLYVNHRPVFGVCNADIADALALLGADEENGGTIPWEELKYRLQHEGEKISDRELELILRALTGGEEPSGEISAAKFAVETLGFAEE